MNNKLNNVLEHVSERNNEYRGNLRLKTFSNQKPNYKFLWKQLISK